MVRLVSIVCQHPKLELPIFTYLTKLNLKHMYVSDSEKVLMAVLLISINLLIFMSHLFSSNTLQ